MFIFLAQTKYFLTEQKNILLEVKLNVARMNLTVIVFVGLEMKSDTSETVFDTVEKVFLCKIVDITIKIP